MNGDLSLSRALGGLRIANPDDADASPSNAQNADILSPPTDRQTDHQSDARLAPLEDPTTQRATTPYGSTPTSDTLLSPVSHTQSPEGPSSAYDGSSSHIESHRTSPSAAMRADVYRQPVSPYSDLDKAAGSRSSVSPTPRPISGLYNQPPVVLDDGRAPHQAHPQADRSRNSVYGMLARQDSNNAPGYPDGSTPTREPSHRGRSANPARQSQLPSASGPLPPRRSSKGMGGGYVSASAAPPGPRDPYGPEMPLPSSSEEWKDRGAAVGVRRETDANGKTVIRHVKKGVRDFSFGRVLGEGSYSTVYLATDRQTLKEYAIKVLEKKHIIKEKKIKYVNIEKNTLNRLTEHPGIVRLYYTFQDEASLYYVLDLCNDDSRAASFVGTAEYVSPELLTSKNACKASDLWAFGCIVYQLLAGRPPFKAATEYLTFQKIVNLEYDFPAGFPPAARDLVERCLVLDPARRLTVEHIKNHEFFDGQQFGKGLWRTKAPRLRPYNPIPQEPTVIQLNGVANSPNPVVAPRNPQPQSSAMNGSARPARIITELPPPTQLDIEWSPVLTKNNERILKLGDLMVVSSPLPNGGHGKGGEHGEGHKKLSRFFGGSTTKKRQRLVMVTSSGRILMAPAGGEEKRAKQEISLLAPDCSWRTQLDVKGQTVWCVDAVSILDKKSRRSSKIRQGGVHYTFEEPKGSSNSSENGSTANDWIESLERAKELALSQNLTGSYAGDNGFDMSSAVSSPSSTLGGRGAYPDGFSVSDRSGRNHLSKSQASLEDPTSNTKRNRFSKRQSKNGLGQQF
ncbi:putative 3-phosphoinositide-dependent protein kinase 2 [Colletotrichum spaethianum]|uniref:non-specific serine/threonine protein kinase n=1 Tax=Colletotrichum spaethianum TaxID=700344 RepID=A0AA37PBY6_9PEZI|nr:putative 3-phosphoinositide-dependent protein kinase 2 [Colletotrichum spaethianum]GKT49463.1 putative 3-phosphoinositide-dependent protein kinase 2 [Colletotrichum spaethianum]